MKNIIFWFKNLFKKKPNIKKLGNKQASWHFIDENNHKIHLCITFYDGKQGGKNAKRCVNVIHWNYTLNTGTDETVLIK